MVTVYSRTTCGPCKMLKKWLDSKGVDYSEKNIETNPEFSDELIKQTGMMTVPVTVVDGEVIPGLNLAKLSSILR